MAARTRKILHDDMTRAKIQATQLVNRLQDHVLGKVKLEATQVTAALGLLKKAVPDLQAITHEGNAEKPVDIRTHSDVASAIVDMLIKSKA